MTVITKIFVFMFGAVVGSFLNAVVWRLRTGESFVFGRSYCPKCRHKLAAVDLVPVLSYLLLRGKCRYCRREIDSQYLFVELAAATLFLAFALRDFGGGAPYLSEAKFAELIFHWSIAAVLIIVFVYDLRYMLILPSVALPVSVLVFLANIALGKSVWPLLLGCVIGGGFFYLLHRLSGGRWVGGGDVYMGLLMGAILGSPMILVALFVAYVAGALVSLGLLAAKVETWKSQIPFGTFLSASTVVALLWGESILNWYLRLAL